MSFILQTEKTNCVPTAVYNALTWGGYEPHLEMLNYEFQPNPKTGVKNEHIERIMPSIHPTYSDDVSLFRNIFWWDIRKHVQEDCGLILFYLNRYNPKKKRNSLGHAVFVFTQNGKYYIVNDKKWTRPTLVQEVDRDHFKNLTERGAWGYFVRRHK